MWVWKHAVIIRLKTSLLVGEDEMLKVTTTPCAQKMPIMITQWLFKWRFDTFSAQTRLFLIVIICLLNSKCTQPHTCTHTHHLQHYWSHKGDRELLTVSHSWACFKWSSNISVAVCCGMFQQALAFICLRVAHFWWFSLTRRRIACEKYEGQKKREMLVTKSNRLKL